MTKWYQKRLARLAQSDFNRALRKSPSMTFIIMFAAGFTGATIAGDLMELRGSNPHWWMKYWLGIIMGAMSVWEHRRLWKEIDKMEGANTSLEPISGS